nr:hypothetical protein [Tanacetum cinerariifolium]
RKVADCFAGRQLGRGRRGHHKGARVLGGGGQAQVGRTDVLALVVGIVGGVRVGVVGRVELEAPIVGVAGQQRVLGGVVDDGRKLLRNQQIRVIDGPLAETN